MNFLVYISDYIVPFTVFYIVGFGLLMKCRVYDCFVKGAKSGMMTVAEIMPTLVGLMVGVGVLRASGFLEFVSELLNPIAESVNFPGVLVPVVLIRLFSASAATGLTLDVFKEYGTDSYIGLLASIIMSCTETVFYTMSLYYVTAGIRKTRWTLTGAMVCTLVGIVACVIIARFMTA